MLPSSLRQKFNRFRFHIPGFKQLKILLCGRDLQLSVWDFAGQEDFYATHPCFISEHAMYIALYDASKGPEQLETLKPWLTAIHARAKYCPVLIIGSHADKLSWYVYFCWDCFDNQPISNIDRKYL